MAEKGYVLGGEQSGHIILSKYATTGDGILTSIALMETMMESRQTLSKLCAGRTACPQVLQNVRVLEKAAVMENAHVQSVLRRMEKRLDGRGRVLLRGSGTEPVVRVMAEAEEESEAQSCVDAIVRAIADEGLEE